MCVCCTIGQAEARAALRISAFSQLPSCLRSWLLMAQGVVDVPVAAAVAAAYALLDMFRLPTPPPHTHQSNQPRVAMRRGALKGGHLPAALRTQSGNKGGRRRRRGKKRSRESSGAGRVGAERGVASVLAAGSKCQTKQALNCQCLRSAARLFNASSRLFSSRLALAWLGLWFATHFIFICMLCAVIYTVAPFPPWQPTPPK